MCGGDQFTGTCSIWKRTKTISRQCPLENVPRYGFRLLCTDFLVVPHSTNWVTSAKLCNFFPMGAQMNFFSSALPIDIIFCAYDWHAFGVAQSWPEFVSGNIPDSFEKTKSAKLRINILEKASLRVAFSHEAKFSTTWKRVFNRQTGVWDEKE